MDNIDIANELRAIKVALEGYPVSTITGGQLFSLIHRVVPDLDIRAVVGMPKGPGALTAFIREYLLDDVERIGNQGGDILYQIAGREITALPTSSSPLIWRTFVSPNSSKHLLLIRSTQRVLVRDTPTSTGESELEVAKASPEEHDKIRADFMVSMPESSAAILREHVAPEADFETWIAALKEYQPQMMPQWGQFRRHRLSELFAARITELKLEEPLQRVVLEQIKASELSAYDTPKAGKVVSAKQAVRQAGGLNDPTDATLLARRLAHVAIDRLSYDDLRALRMPLGVMLDAIRAES